MIKFMILTELYLSPVGEDLPPGVSVPTRDGETMELGSGDSEESTLKSYVQPLQQEVYSLTGVLSDSLPK